MSINRRGLLRPTAVYSMSNPPYRFSIYMLSEYHITVYTAGI